MTLIKRALTVPAHKPYNPNINKIIGYVLATIAGLGLAFLLFSCNATTHTYKLVEKNEPKTANDTARLLKRASTVLKTPAPIIKPGKVITRNIPVIKKVLDTDALNRLSDSLKEAHNQDIISVAEDCDNSVEAARKEGIEAGYKKAQSDISTQTYEDKDPDTIQLSDPKCIADLWLSNNALTKATTLNEQNTATIAKYEQERNSFKWVAIRLKTLLLHQWWFWVILVGSIAWVVLKIYGKFSLPIKL